MKKLIAAFLCTALAVAFGCNTKSTPGGPGVKPGAPSENKTITGAPKGETFTITVPSTTTEVKQGTKKEVSIKLNRGKEFKEDVTLKFHSDAKGVSVEPPEKTIKASDPATDWHFAVGADKEAPISEHTITVTATPEHGSATEHSFKVKVTGGP